MWLDVVLVDDHHAVGRPDRLGDFQDGGVVGVRGVQDVQDGRAGGQVEGGFLARWLVARRWPVGLTWRVSGWLAVTATPC